RRSPALGSMLLRSGETIQLDLDRCRVDLVDFRAGCLAGGAERGEALASGRGNLCDVQFPYDEHLVAGRHAVVAGLTTLGSGVVAGPRDRIRLMPAAAVLDVGDVLADGGGPVGRNGHVAAARNGSSALR